MKKQYLTFKKVLLMVMMVIMVAAKGNAKNHGDTTITSYAKNPHNHSIDEVARGLENGNLPLNMTIDYFVTVKKNLLNEYRMAYNWHGSNGQPYPEINLDAKTLAAIYRASTTTPASWFSDKNPTSNQTAIISYYWYITDNNGRKKTGKDDQGIGFWVRPTWDGEQLVYFSPSKLAGMKGTNYPDVCLGSLYCLQEVYLQQQKQQQRIAQNNQQQVTYVNRPNISSDIIDIGPSLTWVEAVQTSQGVWNGGGYLGYGYPNVINQNGGFNYGGVNYNGMSSGMYRAAVWGRVAEVGLQVVGQLILNKQSSQMSGGNIIYNIVNNSTPVAGTPNVIWPQSNNNPPVITGTTTPTNNNQGGQGNGAVTTATNNNQGGQGNGAVTSNLGNVINTTIGNLGGQIMTGGSGNSLRVF